MKLISVTQGKENWKIEYFSKAPDGETIRATYPASTKDLGLGKPTRAFFQAVAAFTQIAIAISHLDKDWWIGCGARVTAIKLKETKEGESIQITIVADEDDENFEPLRITTHWADIEAAKSMLQANNPNAPYLVRAIADLEEHAEKYINGKRYAEQLELPLISNQQPVISN